MSGSVSMLLCPSHVETLIKCLNGKVQYYRHRHKLLSDTLERRTCGCGLLT